MPRPDNADRTEPLGHAARALLALVAAYRVLLSPLIGGTCRFSPSCSAYAEQAIRLHGALRGARLAARRLARCHPLGGWGLDPVPLPEPTGDPRSRLR